MWTSSKIRQSFLDYFQQQGHQIVASSSLVPVNDPTLLFSNAGMNQFKDVFLGIDQRPYNRATTSQKCVRAGGKHNDLDTVGRTPRHHTFFEMLGNFSFGDYFKEKAIEYAWDYLTRVIGLPKDKLWITIYLDDDDANELWQKVAGVAPGRIIRLGEKDNFWSMGDTGPCGPCSEVHYDRGPEYACGPDCAMGVCDCSRWLEIWNLVFMQFDRNEAGEMVPLPRPSIDTGMGLERLASILMGVESNYDTDLFTPIIAFIEQLTGQPYDKGDGGFAFRVIADHSRACSFLIADGVLPGNEGRSYVLRRILRRAVRFGQSLGLEEPFLYRTVAVVCDIMRDAYPELPEKQRFVEEVIRQEEERFFLTLKEGVRRVDDIIKNAQADARNEISGQEAFMLYDTYGFPLDLTEDMAEEIGFTVDKAGFEAMMQEQRQRARSANKGENAFARDQLLAELLAAVPATEFRGYDDYMLDSEIAALIIGDEKVEQAGDVSDLLVVTAATPFYAESGGQIADIGTITCAGGILTVKDVQKTAGWVIHRGSLQGTLKSGGRATLAIDSSRRMDICRNHTATHLLHQALRTVVGDHAQQKGSLVEAERLRFDFSHLQALSAEEIQQIELMVNEAILAMHGVATVVTGMESARDMGATALFGEKYGDEVRVVTIGERYSMELCGGAHVSNTGAIGLFKILSESSVGSGLRRIEAITGRHALAYLNNCERELKMAAAQLKTAPRDLNQRLAASLKQAREQEKAVEQLKAKMSKAAGNDVLEQAVEVSGAKLLFAQVDSPDANALRQQAEMLKDQLQPAVVLLAAAIDDKVSLACFVSPGLIERGLHAGKLAGMAAKAAGGGGGGRPDMAQAGAKDLSRISEALQAARDESEKILMQ
ncbi:MAG: alanine--tRNA ligase [Syntrophomonadaceae bacterium]|nr:alanine--tRNA ligase [Syntrophomonadaceae bacterium]